MPAGVPVEVVLEIPDAADRQPLASAARVGITWLERDGADAARAGLLERALRKLPAAAGDTFYWIAAESRRARAMRQFLAEERGVAKDAIRATGYWKAEKDGD
jgi:NADPH-dependent ferric siderophore reductase